jgi:hypothetical protein
MALAPLNVVVWSNLKSQDVFDVNIGAHGRVYPLSFFDLMNLIKSRQGAEIKRLEYRK